MGSAQERYKNENDGLDPSYLYKTSNKCKLASCATPVTMPGWSDGDWRMHWLSLGSYGRVQDVAGGYETSGTQQLE